MFPIKLLEVGCITSAIGIGVPIVFIVRLDLVLGVVGPIVVLGCNTLDQPNWSHAHVQPGAPAVVRAVAVMVTLTV